MGPLHLRHGHKHSGLTWELGNELWGAGTSVIPPSNKSPARTAAFSKAIRAVDPDAKLIATGQDPDDYNKWNATQLTNPAGTFDYLSTHFVVTNTDTRTPHADNDFIAQAAFALPIGLEERLKTMQEQIDQIRHSPTRRIWPSRNGSSSAVDPAFRASANMGGAIDTAGFFNMLMRNTDIVPISDMTGIMEFAGIWKNHGQVFAAPGYYAFRMYSTAHPAMPVVAVSNAGSYSVKNGVERLPDIADVPYLDVVRRARYAKEMLSPLLRESQPQHRYPCGHRDSGLRGTAEATVQTLAVQASAMRTMRTSPNVSRLVLNQERVSQGRLQHVFPHESMTVITLHRSAAK